MSRPYMVAIMAMLLGGCADQEPDRIVEDLGSMQVLAPGGWTATKLGDDTRVWTPADNRRRESIAIVIGPTQIGGTKRTFAKTRDAQAGLRDLEITRESSVTTRNGFVGHRLDLTFRSTGTTKRYQRSHVTLVTTDNRIVHVLYTAADPDPSLAALTAVLDTLSIREGG